MEEKDAIELLGKLEKFMKDTNLHINTLLLRVDNLQVDIDNIKKHIGQNRIIVRN